MNMNEDEKWQRLLASSSPAFAGDVEPPFGFVTATLARIRAENLQVEQIERIGWRALLASLAALAVAVAITVTVSMSDRSTEFEPGVRSFVQMENIQVS